MQYILLQIRIRMWLVYNVKKTLTDLLVEISESKEDCIFVILRITLTLMCVSWEDHYILFHIIKRVNLYTLK